MQKDLNMMTLGTMASNHALSNLIESYDSCSYTPENNKKCVKSWSDALNHLNDAIQAFAKDALRLEEYINGKG